MDTTQDPTDELTQVFKLTSVIVDAPNGIWQHEPTTGQMDLDPNTDYYYDVEMTDAGGKLRTIIKSTLKIYQDITKT